MDTQTRLSKIARDLRSGISLGPVSVSEFLSWFGARRRGSGVVASIRKYLDDNDLVTEPDFESAYIYSAVTLKLGADDQDQRNSAVIQQENVNQQMDGAAATAALVVTLDSVRLTASGEVGSVTAAGSPFALKDIYDDPTYRIRKLEAANNAPTYVNPQAQLSAAVTLMMSRDFSQLPVMSSEREVKGIISWSTIGRQLARGKTSGTVSEFCEPLYQEISDESSIFQAIPVIVEHEYVLIRAKDKRIAGIVTATDLSEQFLKLTEPFLLLGEIENHLRSMIRAKFNIEDMQNARDPADDRKVNDVSDLTFGEYKRLLENGLNWSKLHLMIDRQLFCTDLDNVRTIRNDVMHFDPDGIAGEDLKQLRSFAKFLQKLA